MNSLRLQPHHHFHYHVDIDHSQTTVWSLLTDVTRWPEWDTELQAARLFVPFDLGAKGELVPKTGPLLPFEITQLDAGTSYTFLTKMPIGALEIKRTLTSVDEKTRFTDDIRFTGALRWVFGWLLGRGFKAVLPEVMENFKSMAEKSTNL